VVVAEVPSPESGFLKPGFSESQASRSTIGPVAAAGSTREGEAPAEPQTLVPAHEDGSAGASPSLSESASVDDREARLSEKPGFAMLVIAVTLCLLEAVKLVVFCAAGPALRAMDAAHYWSLGGQVAGGDVWMRHNPVAFRTPGYPWFLGALQAVGGESAWFAAVAVQYMAVWLTTLATGWWAYRLTGRPWLGLVALAVCLLSAGRASYAGVLLTETLFTLLLTLLLMRLTAPQPLASGRGVVLVALLWGLSWLLRPIAVALIPVWMIAWWWSRSPSDASRSLRGLVRPVLLTGVVLAGLLGPWVARNAVLFGRPSLTVFLGRELWLATFGPGRPSGAALPETDAARELQRLAAFDAAATDWRNNWVVSKRLTAAGLSDVAADERMQRVAWEGVQADPARALHRALWRGIDYWRAVYSREQAFDAAVAATPPVDEPHRWEHAACLEWRSAWLSRALESRLLVVELTSLAAVVGLIALLLSPRYRQAGVVLTTAVVAIALATSALEHPAYRYRMVLEPALIIATLAGGNTLWHIFRRGVRTEWAEPPQK
jgi:hypothetical protein